MHVDKFGRNGDRTTLVYTVINIANLTNSFLRRDGGSTAIGTINMNSNIIKNVRIRCQISRIESKNYVDTSAVYTGINTDNLTNTFLRRDGVIPLTEPLI